LIYHLRFHIWQYLSLETTPHMNKQHEMSQEALVKYMHEKAGIIRAQTHDEINRRRIASHNGDMKMWN